MCLPFQYICMESRVGFEPTVRNFFHRDLQSRLFNHSSIDSLFFWGEMKDSSLSTANLTYLMSTVLQTAVRNISHNKFWYRRWDSNPYYLVSKTSDSYRWSTPALVLEERFELSLSCISNKYLYPWATLVLAEDRGIEPHALRHTLISNQA